MIIIYLMYSYKALLQQSLSRMFTFFLKFLLAQPLFPNISENTYTGKNNGFPFLDILVYLKNTHKNPKFGKVRQVPTKFPDWDLSHSSKFGILVDIL